MSTSKLNSGETKSPKERVALRGMSPERRASRARQKLDPERPNSFPISSAGSRWSSIAISSVVDANEI
jgi:hypothetical protein